MNTVSLANGIELLIISPLDSVFKTTMLSLANIIANGKTERRLEWKMKRKKGDGQRGEHFSDEVWITVMLVKKEHQQVIMEREEVTMQ